MRGREREAAGLSLPSFRPDVPHQWVAAVLHISSTRSMVLSLQRQGEGRLLPLGPRHGVTAGLAVVPAVGDLTGDVEGLLQVDGVRNHLQRQPDVSVSRRLACVKEEEVNRRDDRGKLPGDGSDHSLQLARLEPPPLPEIGLPHDVQLADHRHALDDSGLLRVLRLRLQAVQILPGVHGLQVGHLAEGALPGRGRREDEESRLGCTGPCLHCFYSVSLDVIVLSSVTLYIMDGSRETFSMNMGEVVMFWI